MKTKSLLPFMLVLPIISGCTGGQQTSSSSQSFSDSSSTKTSSIGSSSTDSSSNSSSEEEHSEEFKDIQNINGRFIFNGKVATSAQPNSLALFNYNLAEKGVEVTIDNTKGSISDNGIIFNYANTGSKTWEGEGISFYFVYISQRGYITLASSVDGTWKVHKEMHIRKYNKNNPQKIKFFKIANRIFIYCNDFLYIYFDETNQLVGSKFGIRAGSANVTFTKFSKTDDESKLNFVSYRSDMTDDSDFDLVEGWNILKYTDADMQQIETAIYLPRNYNPNRKYPIELFLHGDGTVGQNALQNLFYGEGTALARKPADEHPEDLIIVNPANNKSWLNVYKDLHPDYKYGHNEYGGAIINPELNTVLNFMDKCYKSLSVDTDRVYLTGYSRGCMAAEYLLSTYPNMFTSAVVASGRGDPACAKNFKDVPVWFWAGNSDTVVLPEESQIMYDAYTAAGGKGRLTRIDGRDHGSLLIDISDSDEWYGFLTGYTKKDPCEHEYGQGRVIRQATCQCFEMLETECSKCHSLRVYYGEMGDHRLEDGVCKDCGYVDQNSGWSKDCIDTSAGFKTIIRDGVCYYENETSRASRIFGDKMLVGTGSFSFDYRVTGLSYKGGDRIYWVSGLMFASRVTDKSGSGQFLIAGQTCTSSQTLASAVYNNSSPSWSTGSTGKNAKIEDDTTYHFVVKYDIPNKILNFKCDNGIDRNIIIPDNVLATGELYLGLWGGASRNAPYGKLVLSNFDGDFQTKK